MIVPMSGRVVSKYTFTPGSYLEIQPHESARAVQQRLNPFFVGLLVLKHGHEHVGPDTHTLRHDRHEPLLVRVGVVQCREQERPFGLDSNVEAQELA